MYKIKYNINLKLLEEFNNYAHCYCCERHQKNRPDKIMPLSLYKLEIISESKNNCVCNCRHNSRNLCNDLEKLGYFCIETNNIDNNIICKNNKKLING